MTATTPKRPPMLTATCVYLGVFALIQTISAIDLVSTWNGENGADRVQRALQALRDTGMGQGEAESFYKGFLTVLAALAASGIIFAIYTARGDRASRWGLTIVMTIVGLCFFAGATGGSFLDVLLGALSIAFITRLWRGDARAWFRALAGHEPEVKTQKPQKVQHPDEPEAPRPLVGASAPTASEPSPPQPAAPAPWQSGPSGPPPVGYQVPAPRAGGREPLPKPVAVATWTTFVASLVVALFSAIGVLVLGLIGDDFERLMRDSPFSESLLDPDTDFDAFRQRTMIVYGLFLALSIGGLVASTWVLAKRRSGDVFLFVMAAVTVATSFLAFPLGLPFGAAAIVVIVQLRKPESRRWFAQT